jgi:transposase
VVADRGMLSKNNITLTTEKGYKFILGERLKSLPKAVQAILLEIKQYRYEWIYNDNEGEEVQIKYTTIQHEGKTIIATYSSHRAKKDKLDREDKLNTAQKLIANPALLKKKPARFFLQSDGKENYILNEQKIQQSEKYDGFLAISTDNTTLNPTQVLEQYKQLYKIEHSFRTFKSHLETRPLFHWTDKRMEGHICLCYITFALQNYVLQKANKLKPTFTESSLRKTINSMQLSLLKHNTEKVYLRSKPSENEIYLQQNMGVIPLLPIMPASKLNIQF